VIDRPANADLRFSIPAAMQRESGVQSLMSTSSIVVAAMRVSDLVA
jgi:hypothetical protein